MNADGATPTIAVIGGTGREGKGLAYRWAKAGYPIIIGSRSAPKAAAAAAEVRAMVEGGGQVSGASNVEAAAAAEVVVVAVPFEVHEDILLSIRAVMHAQLVVDVTVPLDPSRPTRVRPPPSGSAAQATSLILGKDCRVAAAFHTISHEHLLRDDPIECDVLVTGTSTEVRAEALGLVAAAGLTGWDAGPLENSAVSEGLTSVLIHINKKYGSRQAGIRITGARQP